MSQTIKQLWNGNIESIYHYGRDKQEIQKLEELLQRNLQKLNEMLGEKEKCVLDNYTLCIEEYLWLTTEQAFCDGFSMGTKLVAEAMIGG